ncbi:MAG: shikimate dehydrogenase [Cyanobacteriota bacterium]|nr:shikimate dehydrogenase [Cyanobacteriota bacterium]
MATPISAHTALLGVLGDPIRHSLSPAMHNAALAALGLDWVYLALPAAADRLTAVVQGLDAMGCRGLSVTIPHKQSVAALCRQLSPLAQRLGAVNTLVPMDGGGWFGTNTDVEGFLAPLRGEPWQGKRAVVLGCGGSARAVVAGLVDLQLSTITVVGRRADAREAFAAGCADWAPQLHTQPWQPGGLGPLLARADLVVNTTPAGMASASDPAAAQACPLDADELQALQASSTAYDLIYVPRPTRFLRQAADRGCRSIDGLTMLVHQGAAALRLWSGRNDVPIDAMTAALEAALATPT